MVLEITLKIKVIDLYSNIVLLKSQIGHDKGNNIAKTTESQYK